MGGLRLTAAVEIPEGGAEGILTALGDRHGGWAFYLHEGRPTAAFALLDGTVRVAAETPVPAGRHTLELCYEPGPAARVVLAVDGSAVAEAPLPGLVFFPHLTTAGAGLLVGRDRGLPVCGDYRPPYAFSGTLHQVELRSGHPGAGPEQSATLRAALAGD